MISLNEFLVKKHTNEHNYKYHPKTKKELKDICFDLLKDGQTDLNNVDTSKITDMSWLFNNIDGRFVKVKDIDISQWNVSKVTNMYGMFCDCEQFNSDLSDWDVSKVKDMGWMFNNCIQFNCDLSKWNTSNVKNMQSMFVDCKQFNSDLSGWNVSKVKDMDNMFVNCKQFNSDLSNWNVSKVTNMYDMFEGCTSLKTKPSWYKG